VPEEVVLAVTVEVADAEARRLTDRIAGAEPARQPLRRGEAGARRQRDMESRGVAAVSQEVVLAVAVEVAAVVALGVADRIAAAKAAGEPVVLRERTPA
jgi:hypothetical protein